MKKVQLRHPVELLKSRKEEHPEPLETVGDHVTARPVVNAVAVSGERRGVQGPDSRKAGDTAPSLCSLAACTRGLHFWKDGMSVDDTLAPSDIQLGVRPPHRTPRRKWAGSLSGACLIPGGSLGPKHPQTHPLILLPLPV